jgi:hypothetical protein
LGRDWASAAWYEARRERMSLVNMLPACARTLVAS